MYQTVFLDILSTEAFFYSLVFDNDFHKYSFVGRLIPCICLRLKRNTWLDHYNSQAKKIFM